MHRLLAILALSLALLLIGCIAGSIELIDPDEEDSLVPDGRIEALPDNGDCLARLMRAHQENSILLQLHCERLSDGIENTIRFFCGWYSSSYSELDSKTGTCTYAREHTSWAYGFVGAIQCQVLKEEI